MPNFLFIPYVYTVTTGSITAGSQSILPLLTDQDADFELHRIYASSSLDATIDVRPNYFTFQIADKSNGRNWSDSQVSQSVAVGVEYGMKMDRPVLLAARSNLSITFVSIASSTAVFKLALVGAKVLQYQS